MESSTNPYVRTLLFLGILTGILSLATVFVASTVADPIFIYFCALFGLFSVTSLVGSLVISGIRYISED